MKTGLSNKSIIVFFILAFAGTGPFAGAMEFFYKYKTGDKYRIVSMVNEDVYVDRKLSYKAEIVNRISVEITGIYGGKARHSAVFLSAEKTIAAGNPPANSVKPFLWSRNYDSVYEQDRFGNMTIADNYFMPMVRNVPFFPARDLVPGDTWSARGTEVYDFRDNFGIEKPYRIPFTANYTYLGERKWKEKNYPAFSISYRVFLEPEAVPGTIFPRRILTASDQTVYWDTAHGQAAGYEEYFRIAIDLSDGQTWDYRGRAGAEVIESPPMNKEAIARDIEEEIRDIPDASVRVSNEGVVISLEDIQFDADSSELRASERPKLDRIAGILLKYPDRDILVGGHTALAGSAEGRFQLSLERAGAVADYFIGKKVRGSERVVIRGYGAEQPVADNSTAGGMRKNRRVEIIILEN